MDAVLNRQKGCSGHAALNMTKQRIYLQICLQDTLEKLQSSKREASEDTNEFHKNPLESTDVGNYGLRCLGNRDETTVLRSLDPIQLPLYVNVLNFDEFPKVLNSDLRACANMHKAADGRIHG